MVSVKKCKKELAYCQDLLTYSPLLRVNFLYYWQAKLKESLTSILLKSLVLI
jgi:hypothetical protein